MVGVVVVVAAADGLLDGEDERYDEPVQPQHLGENEDEDHAHE